MNGNIYQQLGLKRVINACGKMTILGVSSVDPEVMQAATEAALKALVLKGPKLERDGCVAWRARDLCDVVERRFGVRYGESGMLRLLKGLDLSWQKARPVHPDADPKAQERFKKPCPV